jgi:hypothetical protein
MVSLSSLWLPILLSAIAVFFLSALVHMVLPYHKGDYARLPAEDDVMAALGRQNLGSGDYVFPFMGPGAMKDPAWIEKRKRGPAGLLSIMPTEMGMGKQLAQWFVFTIVVSLLAAYVSGRALPVAADGGEVFRFATTVAFLSYGMATLQESIWFNRKWSTTWKHVFDALLFAVVTGLLFCFLWPK